MLNQTDVNVIVNELSARRIIGNADQIVNNRNGTTEGLVYTIWSDGEPRYVLKRERTDNLVVVENLLATYRDSALFPKLLYFAPDKTFIVYSYITGETHHNRGSKIDWLSLLVTELLNRYVIYQETDGWGRLEWPVHSWREFNERSLEGARENIGSRLPADNYETMKSLIEKISQVDESDGRYLLHGDMGVHNFVFHGNKLKGVIDPSPMAGPVLYDFTYAFCSSPDDLTVETLFEAYALFRHEQVDRSRLIEEVVFQLYCRISICIQHHPHDLEGYLKAWNYWKALISKK
ncbi:phosphotransferase [Cohnella luojiensis]|uniref:Aminoglycoside phosphotransferase domain-containing protein n=1 Tax=Cohnella luojiensis TaxID=652876 RepID=A0A4Y8M215_9BACL|nr:phosphotransferase [Cohnella luojiensis]TFE25954.1 hypothetical protein E2980_12350 [Cohnella luojiensis]